MSTRIITHNELDRWLDKAAADPERFTESVRELATQLDKKKTPLQIESSTEWMRQDLTGESSGTPRAQFRQDVEAFEQLDRETEGRLARRVEFARERLKLGLAAVGIEVEDNKQLARKNTCLADVPEVKRKLIGRRWDELHALRTELVTRNLYLVLINVERYAHTSASRMDLIQEGSAALFRAVDGFDWRRGLLFRTYAVHWLNQAFRQYLYNCTSTVRVPVYLQKAIKHIYRAIEELETTGKATIEAISERTGLGQNLVKAALEAQRSTHSLDGSSGSDDDDRGRLRDQLPGDGEGDPYHSGLEDSTLSDSLRQALARLSERERLVVTSRFGIGIEHEMTLSEVAKILGVSLERVRQIQVRAMAKMNTPDLRRAADTFLEN